MHSGAYFLRNIEMALKLYGWVKKKKKKKKENTIIGWELYFKNKKKSLRNNVNFKAGHGFTFTMVKE